MKHAGDTLKHVLPKMPLEPVEVPVYFYDV